MGRKPRRRGAKEGDAAGGVVEDDGKLGNAQRRIGNGREGEGELASERRAADQQRGRDKGRAQEPPASGSQGVTVKSSSSVPAWPDVVQMTVIGYVPAFVFEPTFQDQITLPPLEAVFGSRPAALLGPLS